MPIWVRLRWSWLDR